MIGLKLSFLWSIYMYKRRRPIGVATINLQNRMLVAIVVICLGIVLNM